MWQGRGQAHRTRDNPETFPLASWEAGTKYPLSICSFVNNPESEINGVGVTPMMICQAWK